MNGITDNWGEALLRQQAEADNAVANRNQQFYGQLEGLDAREEAAAQARSQMRDVANAYAFINASSHGGYLPRGRSDALSGVLGQRVEGGMYLANGDFAYLGASPTERGKIGITGRVSPLTQMAIVQRAKLGDKTLPWQRSMWQKLTEKYAPSQLEGAGVHNPDGARAVAQGSEGNLTTGEMSDGGAKPGYRKPFHSERDEDGTPFNDDDRPGRRYHGHGISTFSTAAWKEDREEKRRREDMAHDVLMEQAKAKGRSVKNGRSVDEQMAIDDNRGKNAVEAEKAKIGNRMLIENMRAYHNSLLQKEKEWNRRINDAQYKANALGKKVKLAGDELKAAKEGVAAEIAKEREAFEAEWQKRIAGDKSQDKPQDKPQGEGVVEEIAGDGAGAGAGAGEGVIDVSGIKTKEEMKKALAEAAEGTRVTLGGKTKVKRGGKWVEE